MNATIISPVIDTGSPLRTIDTTRAGNTGLPTTSTVSWAAIIAGAFVAASASLILLALGSGLGFASLSFWAAHETPIKTFAVTAVIWLIVSQWISSGLGGYIAGRLRSRWIGTHVHEVFFRDTAHGLVTWAVGTVAAAVVAGSIVSAMDMGVSRHAGAGGDAATAKVGAIEPGDYSIDKLFRPDVVVGAAGGASTTAAPVAPAVPALSSEAETRAQTRAILANAIVTGSIPAGDRAWLTAEVMTRAGVSQTEAQSRVDGLVVGMLDEASKLRAAADEARKAAAEAAIYVALSLLIGAFIACVAAALGGRLRDEHP